MASRAIMLSFHPRLSAAALTSLTMDGRRENVLLTNFEVFGLGMKTVPFMSITIPHINTIVSETQGLVTGNFRETCEALTISNDFLSGPRQNGRVSETRIDMARFAKALTARRTRLGLSKRQLAERAGISGPYVGELESGTGSRPSVDVLVGLAAALKTTPDELLRDFGLPTSAPVAGELSLLYRQLGADERDAWVQIGYRLRELQERYGTRNREEEEPPTAEDPNALDFAADPEELPPEEPWPPKSEDEA